LYVGQTAKKRTLIEVLGRTCIYTFDDVVPLLLTDLESGKPTVRATTCTPRSFIAAVGGVPNRSFTEEEARYLRSGVVSFRPRRLCNKKERALFFPPDEDSTDRKAAAEVPVVTPKAVAESGSVDKSTDGDEPKKAKEPWYRCFQKGCRKILRRS
jgi:hypothetical protein